MAATVKQPTGGWPPIRSYGARRGRLSPLTVERLDRLSSWLVPTGEGPLDDLAVFGRRAPLVLDVGCGHGAAAVAYAELHPEHDVLGVDVYVPGVARMLAAADAADVGNLRASVGDAVRLLSDRVPPGRLGAVHLFFPDPWPKAKHAKRRFVSPYTLELLASRLAPDGQVLVATDQEDYARYVVQQVRLSGVLTAHPVARPDWRPVDGFEAKALAAGRAVTELVLSR